VVITVVSLKLPHDRDARAVRERKVLIMILEKESPRPFEAIVLDTLPPQSGASVDLLPPCIRGCPPQAKSNERQRLIDDEVSRDQDATSVNNGAHARRLVGDEPRQDDSKPDAVNKY
jgi:hypothetical protein